jgi:integrase/recombinase XerD
MSSQRFGVDAWMRRLEAHLQSERYVAQITRHYGAVARRFLTYLGNRRVDIGSALPSHVRAYLQCELRRYRQRHGRSPRDLARWRYSFTSGVHQLLRVAQGVWPPVPSPANPTERLHREICTEYARWLAEVRGLAQATITDRCQRGEQFLHWLGEHGTAAELSQLNISRVDEYLRQRALTLRRSTRKSLALNLRSFLRYLHGSGWVSQDLSPAVSAPTLYAFESIPSALRPEDIGAVLNTARRDRTAKGRRDFAILMLLATYGLRAGEITALRLGDIDWRHGVLRIHHSKTGAQSLLPLLESVGNALLDYLRHGRPRSPAREVFLRSRAPYRPFHDGSSLHTSVARRLAAAGICVAGKHGPHAFRHAHAVSLLRAQVPLKVIGDLLGHRAADSTAVYLKLATADLRAVALEVPA